MVRLPASGRHHLRNDIHAKDLTFWSGQGGYAQGRLAGTRRDVENCVPTVNLSILDQGLADRRKHLPYDFAVFLPERCGTAPSVDNLLVGLHEQKPIILHQRCLMGYNSSSCCSNPDQIPMAANEEKS